MLIALSGGVDSVALFCILMKMRANDAFQLAAVHVHHGLRETADRDAVFCENLCKQYHVPFFLKHVHLSSSSENDARTARYKAFAEVYQDWQADALVLAHHQADQAETVLLHLLRGCGGKGLAGMTHFAPISAMNVTMNLFRPLLNEEKQDLAQIVMDNALSHCEDETNQSEHYLRNFLRLRIIPLAEKRIPKAVEAICRTAEIMQAENDYLENQVSEFLQKHACMCEPLPQMDIQPFHLLHIALRRRVMQRFIPMETNAETLFQAADIQSGGCVNLSQNAHLIASDKRIYLQYAHAQHPSFPSLLAENAYHRTGNGKKTQAVTTTLLKECVLRYRSAGDFIQPFGMSGTKSLQDYLVDRKIDAPVRDYLPLLCIGSEVLWVIGVGASEKLRTQKDSECILLQYQSRLCFEKDTKGE